MRFSLKTVLTSLLVALAFCATSSTASFAVDGLALRISPTKQQITLQPGQTYQMSVEVTNTGSQDLHYKATATPFSISADDETYKNTNTKDKGPLNAIVDWVTFSSPEGTLNPNQKREINYTITVPADAAPGGQYATINISSDGSGAVTNGESIGLNQEIGAGVLLYATVAGDAHTAGSVKNNSISSFFFAPPIVGTSLVENTGNVHSDATYVLQVWPLFSDEEVYTNEEHPDTYTILPGTRRLVTTQWEDAPQLGIFWVQQTVRFAGTESITAKLVFICPMWLLILVIFLIIFLAVWLVMRNKQRKQDEKAQSTQQKSTKSTKKGGSNA